MDHTLLNPNQLCNYQLDVHDNPFDRTTDLHIDTQSDLQIPLKTKGTVIYFNTWAPTRAEIDANPHIQLSSAAEWNPSTFRFPGSTEDEEEDYMAVLNISTFMSNARRTAQLDTFKPLVNNLKVKPDIPGDSVVGYTPALYFVPVRLSNPAHSTRSIVHRGVAGVPGLLNFRTGCVLEGSFAHNA
jgi:hypothetical protein